jgi:flagellar basal body-associated protein FliL
MSDTAFSTRAAAAQELLRRGAPAPAPVPEAEPEGKQKKGKKGAAGADGEAKKSPKKKIIIVFVVLALVGFEAKGKLMKPHYKAGLAPNASIFALGSTTITTNLSDGHLAQVGISLQLTKAASSKTITADIPELTDSTIRILSGETYNGLLGPAGRASFAAALLHAFQSDLGTSEGAQQVSAIYFTDFVLQ